MMRDSNVRRIKLQRPIGNTFTTVEGGNRIESRAGPITRTAHASTNTNSEALDAANLGVDNVYASPGDTTLIAAPSGSWLVGGGGSNTYPFGDLQPTFSRKTKRSQPHLV